MLARGAKNDIVGLEARRNEVARLYLKGASQYEISRELHVSQPTVCLDLKALRAEWLKWRVGDYNERVDAELARLEHLEYVTWQAYERSCEMYDEKGKLLPRKAPGDKGFLERIAWCIDTRLKLFGLYKQPDTGNKQENNFFVQWDKLYERQPITDPLEPELRQLEARALEHNTAQVKRNGEPRRGELIEAERHGDVITPKVQGAPAKPRKTTPQLREKLRNTRNGG